MADDLDDLDYLDDIPEDHVTFADCTCEHPPESHGWGACNVPECPCEGGWEE